MKTFVTTICLSAATLLVGCADETSVLPESPPASPHVLAVTSHHGIDLYDVDTGEKLPGSVHAEGAKTDMQAIASGKFLVNLTDDNAVLAMDPEGNEAARIDSSDLGVIRPVHSYVYSERGREKYWIASSDHDNAAPSSVSLFDIDPDSPTYLTRVGEHPLGTGHHKAAVSSRTPRMVLSNMFDCDTVLEVIDFTNPADIETVAILSAEEAGWDGVTRTCSVEESALPRPHGCAYADATGRAYCAFTATGEIASLNLDSDAPSFVTMTTGGSGAGYTKAHAGGRYVFSVQSSPREGNPDNPGVTCQIGQLVVIDSQSDAIAAEVPMLYEGPDCSTELADTPQAAASPYRLEHTHDGTLLFVSLGSGRGTDGYIEYEVVYDVSTPEEPVQLPSIRIGKGGGHHGHTLTGDDKYLFVVNNFEDTVSQIDVATRSVVRTITTESMPQWVATYGAEIGPSHQVGPTLDCH